MADTMRIKNTTIERGVRVRGGDDSYDESGVPLKALAVASLKQKRDQEKQELVRLNERFAVYIERVRVLEAQNKKLLADLEQLRQKWGSDSRRIKEQYEPELAKAREEIDNITTVKADAEIKAKRSEYEATNYKRQHDDAINQINHDRNKISNLEYLLQENRTELDLLNRQIKDATDDIEKYKTEVTRLNAELKSLLEDLDKETFTRVKLENEKQTLEEQIPFLNAIHEQEMAELRSLQAGAHIDPAQFYRHELERAIRDIRGDFEQLNETQRRELEEWYKIKTEEITEQLRKREALDSSLSDTTKDLESLKLSAADAQKEYFNLKQINAELIQRLNACEERLDLVRRDNGYQLEQRDREISDLRSKLQDMMNDYDELMNNKTSLEFEINTYRRLLESEEHRVQRTTSSTSGAASNVIIGGTYKPSTGGMESSGISATVTNVSHQQQQPSDYRLSTSEMSAKTTFQRSAKGPVSISECSPDGKVIILENTSRNKDISMANWVLKRRVDNKPEITYKFPDNLTLKANKVVRIWARGHGKENLPTDLVNKDIENWGMGVNIVTIVLNDVGDEKATHLQKTVYAS
jgi:intermediate filament protein if